MPSDPKEDKKRQLSEWIFKVQFLSTYYTMQGLNLTFILFLFLMKVVEIQMDFKAKSPETIISRLYRIQFRVRFTAILYICLIVGFLPAYIILSSIDIGYFFKYAIQVFRCFFYAVLQFVKVLLYILFCKTGINFIDLINRVYPILNRRKAVTLVVALTLLSSIECLGVTFYWITLTVFDR